MENTEKKYYERSYKLALENTKYNSGPMSRFSTN